MFSRNKKPLSGILASCFFKRKKPNKYCFGNQTKFLIFLRNNHDCMVVDPYKARKRYTVTESLALIVSVFLVRRFYRGSIFLQRKLSIFLRNERFFCETIMTVSLSKVLIFLRNNRTYIFILK